MQKELEEASKETRTSSPDRVSLKEAPLCLRSSVPTKVSFKFVGWSLRKRLIIHIKV